jgi:prepilin-type N-terminal cleavage/methylation domain-containing protein
MSPTRRTWRARRGFTLVELMVAIVMLGVVVGALLAVVVEQQRFYDGASEVMEVRDNLRRIGDLLPAELRGVAPRDGDIYAMTDAMIDFRAPSGSSIICEINNGRTVIAVPPVSLSSDAGLTSWTARPLMSDSLFIFDPRDTLVDTMIANRINAAPSSGSCPTTTGFTSTSAEASAAVAFVLSDTLSATIPIGAPIRFYRRTRYSLYQASDGQWYLGYRDFVPARTPAWTEIQPVAGPLMPYAASGATGLRFTYRDSLGTALTSITDAARVRSIEIVARAQSATVIRSSGTKRSSSGHYVDSLRTVVALRNY